VSSDTAVANYLEDVANQGDLSADERADVDAVRALLGDARLWDEPSSSLESSIVAMIGSTRLPSSGPLPVDSAPVMQATVVDLHAKRSVSARWGGFVAGLAVAAAIAGAVLLVNHQRSTTQSAGGQKSALIGQGSLPDASGRIVAFATSSGLRIELDAIGLPRLDNGDFYEAWLKSTDGTTLVPVGTFHTGAKVTLWAGVDSAGYPTFTVTREHVAGPKDTEQGSSGDVVLKGTLSG
jgi:Anti-sigma-K factor rskA